MSNHFTGLSLGPPLGDQRLDLLIDELRRMLAIRETPLAAWDVE